MKIENYKLKIIFFGTPDFVVPVLESLITHFNVVGVVTTPDTLEGRKKNLTPSPVKQAFLEKNHDRYISTEVLGKTVEGQLRELQPDLFVVAAYGKIIPQTILDIPKFGSINIHPSLLPKYRGPSPIQSTIRNGEAVTGVTIIQLDAEMDHGPILSQWEYTLLPDDTFASLHVKLFQQAAEKLPHVIKEFTTGKLHPTEQNHNEATFCQKITREDGYFDILQPPSAKKLDLMIRAFYPWPTAWTRLPDDFGGQAKKERLLSYFLVRKYN